MSLREPGGSLQVVPKATMNPVHVRKKSFAFCSISQSLLINRPQHQDGIEPRLVPKIAVEPGEQLDRVRVPCPTEIQSDFFQRQQFFGYRRNYMQRVDLWHMSSI